MINYRPTVEKSAKIWHFVVSLKRLISKISSPFYETPSRKLISQVDSPESILKTQKLFDRYQLCWLVFSTDLPGRFFIIDEICFLGILIKLDDRLYGFLQTPSYDSFRIKNEFYYKKITVVWNKGSCPDFKVIF